MRIIIELDGGGEECTSDRTFLDASAGAEALEPADGGCAPDGRVGCRRCAEPDGRRNSAQHGDSAYRRGHADADGSRRGKHVRRRRGASIGVKSKEEPAEVMEVVPPLVSTELKKRWALLHPKGAEPLALREGSLPDGRDSLVRRSLGRPGERSE